MDCSPPGSFVHGILQARILEWVAISSSRGSSQPKDRTWVSYIAGEFFTHWGGSPFFFFFLLDIYLNSQDYSPAHLIRDRVAWIHGRQDLRVLQDANWQRKWLPDHPWVGKPKLYSFLAFWILEQLFIMSTGELLLFWWVVSCVFDFTIERLHPLSKYF